MRKGIRVTVAGSKDVRKRATEALSGSRYSLKELATVQGALASVRSEQPDVLVIQGELAAATLRQIRAASPGTKLITVHSARGAAGLGSAEALVADDLLFSPVSAAELKIRVDRVVQAAKVAAARMAGPAAPASAQHSAPLVTELHDPSSGRVDAKRISAYLDVPLAVLSRAIGREYKAVFKSPSSASLQAALSPVHRLVVALHRVYGNRAHVLAWLNTANPELGGARPVELVLEGRAEVAADLVEATLAGVPT